MLYRFSDECLKNITFVPQPSVTAHFSHFRRKVAGAGSNMAERKGSSARVSPMCGVRIDVYTASSLYD
jgi:hypothetical protein